MSQNATDVHVLGLMALELSGGEPPRRPALGQDAAGALAEKLARDLAKLVPAVADLELTFFAAHFDPAEALRPGWPLHRRLEELRVRAPGRNQGPRIIAFGSGAGTADTGEPDIPQPLQANADLSGGALRVLPFLVSGNKEAIDEIGAAFEEILLERGMAGADTALLAQNGFGAKIEHARYLTLHDLAAMMALQYQHGGLEALWPLIETALYQPEGEAWLDAPPEPLMRYTTNEAGAGEVRIGLFDAASWRKQYAPDVNDDDPRLERAYESFLMRQRQLAAVLEAHGIDVVFAHVPEKYLRHDGRDALKD